MKSISKQSQEPYKAERGYRVMVELSEAAEKNGTSEMTLGEINAEIAASRRERGRNVHIEINETEEFLFSEMNVARLRESEQQFKEGRVIVKTMKELEAMANE